MPQLDFFSWQVIVEIIGLFTFLFYFLYLKNLISYIYLIEYVWKQLEFFKKSVSYDNFFFGLKKKNYYMIDDRILFNTYIFDSNVGIFIDVEEENEDDDSDDYLASDDYNNLPDYDIIDEIFRS